MQQIEDMTPILLPRSPNRIPDSGHWFRAPDGVVIIGCPSCGATSPLKAPPHMIDPDGSVWPSVVCPSCNQFHAMVKLDDFGLSSVSDEYDGFNCPTCSHVAHPTAACDCGCQIGSGWHPEPVLVQSPILNVLPDGDVVWLAMPLNEHILLGVTIQRDNLDKFADALKALKTPQGS